MFNISDIITLMKAAIIVGHSDKLQGATNYLGETEYSFNSRIACAVKDLLADRISVNVYAKNNHGSYGIAREVAKFNPEVAIELHFNSFKEVAYGCEILILDSQKKDYAQKLAKEINKKFLIRLRGDKGVKKLSSGDRGFKNLHFYRYFGVKYPMILEPCFGNYKTRESERIFENEKEYIRLIADYLLALSIKKPLSYWDFPAWMKYLLGGILWPLRKKK